MSISLRARIWQQIALFDDDKVHVHTIFRLPGFIAQAIGKLKVEVLAQQYDQWHAGIEPVAGAYRSRRTSRA